MSKQKTASERVSHMGMVLDAAQELARQVAGCEAPHAGIAWVVMEACDRAGDMADKLELELLSAERQAAEEATP